MLDTLIFRVIAIIFALLFITAAVHKLNSRAQFRSVLLAYQILPGSLVLPLAALIPLVEISLGLAWLATAILSWPASVSAFVSALVLTAYTSAIAVNLLRGRSYIDCGCNHSAAIGSSVVASGVQQLSVALLVRNSVLIAIALLAANSSNGRLLGVFDYVNLVLACLALVFVYAAQNQLLANRNAMGSWRHSNG